MLALKFVYLSLECIILKNIKLKFKLHALLLTYISCFHFLIKIENENVTFLYFLNQYQTPQYILQR